MLELDEIHTYYDESHVLKGVNLSVQDGETVGLLGRNGAGKTTTLRSITGIQQPRSGRVIFSNTDISNHSIENISNLGIKLVMEDRRPFPNFTVEENLVLCEDQTFGTSWTLSRIYNTLPRLEERNQQEARVLSGGEQQMLVIAQALIGNPKLILLDEPFEGLAPQIIDQIINIINEIKSSNISTVIVEQNFDLCLNLIDRGYIIHKGEIQFKGSENDIRSNTGTIDKYLGVEV